MQSFNTVILAAGQGKRMHSNMPKGLQKVSGESMLQHVIDAANEIGSDQIICVVGHQKEKIMDSLKGQDVVFVEQAEQLGTGHATRMAEDYFGEGDVLVLYFDTPLLTAKTLKEFVDLHKSHENAASLISTLFDHPGAMGRILRNESGDFQKIVEYKNATPSEKLIKEINSGVGIFDAKKLKEKLHQLTNDNKQGEYLLTDVFELLIRDHEKVDALIVEDSNEVLGVNDKYSLSMAEQVHQQRIKKELMLSGVTMIQPDTIFIHKSVTIEPDATIYPGTQLRGNTKIGTGCKIGPNTDLLNCTVGDYCSVVHSVVESAVLHNGVKVGPFAYLRPNTELHDQTKVGGFVEIKNSTVGKGSKIPHLSYVGDGEIGEDTNISCGTIFGNYNGDVKQKTIVGSHSFVGCNSNLIAPVKIGDHTYIAAGTTVTDSVPDGMFAKSRVKQEIRVNTRIDKK